MKGGTLRTYKDKTYLPLTNAQIIKHLNGEQLIGIYPLLKDNTSWFIAADFDEEKSKSSKTTQERSWSEESLALIEACKEKGIPADLERSRSGQGGHVWIFFDQPYPAIRSRKIIISLLENVRVFSVFDKSSSFDRLFPNQDFLSGKGLGNLIALPLHKPAWRQGNSCFVDILSDGLCPYPDQWKFLASIQRASVTYLDKMHQSLTADGRISPFPAKANSEKLYVTLDNTVRLDRSGMSSTLINFLKEELNFPNSEYFIKKKTGRSTWGTERYFKSIEATENEVIVPRGFMIVRAVVRQNGKLLKKEITRS